jgi:hypothetical protein
MLRSQRDHKISLSSETSESPYNVQDLSVRIINNDICNHRYQFLLSMNQKQFIGNDMLCVNPELGSDTCKVWRMWVGEGGGFQRSHFPLHMVLGDPLINLLPLSFSFPVCKAGVKWRYW